ncbi:hypothetical protein [Kistimonas scapharcae]
MNGVPLKCCPCCGSGNVCADSEECMAMIWCEDCGISVHSPHHQAIHTWNRRHYEEDHA